LSSFTHEFTWLQPEAGNHDIRFRIFGQRPIDNNGIDFDFDLFAQTSVIGANQAPVIDLIGLNQVVAEGASLVIPLNATDPDPNDTLTFSQSGLPAFCNLTDNGDGTGSITCNPASGDAGTSNVLVTVTDDGTPPLSDSDRFVLTVTANQPPVLDAIGSQTVIEGNTLSIPLSATDPDPSDTLTFSQSGLPAFCSLTDNGNGTGAIACSPAPGDAGTYNVTVTVTDDGGLPQSDSESFLLTVEQVVSQPLTATLNDQQPANPVPIGTSVAYTITTTNIDPAGGTIGTGVFVYVDGALQPANAGEFSANGCSVDSAFPSAWACNNLTAAAPQQTYTLTWLAPAAGTHNMRFEVIGQRPIDNIGPPDFSINLERQTVIDSNSPVVNITAPSVVNDTDGQPGEDVQVTGSAIDVEDGALPPTSFRWFVNNTEIVNVAGQEAPTLRLPDGVNTVGLEATDSDSLSTRIDVEITVNAPPSSTNDSPILGAIGNLTVPEGELLDVAIAASDPNPNDVLAFTQTGLPSFCSFTDNGDGTGSIACNPSLGDAGTYSVTVTVTDDGNPRLSDAETFSLVVEEVAAPAVSVIAAGSSDVAISVEDTDGLAGETIQVTGSATDPQDGELPPDSFRWFVNGTEVTEAAGQATAALALDDGDNTIEFEATDSDNNTTRTSVTVSVAQPAFADGPISDRPGLTPNETETAVGLEDTCGNIIEVGNPTQEQQDLLALCATLASDESSDADVAETLNAISGEQITSQKATSIDFASVQLSNVGSRITALRTLGLRGSRGVSTAGLNLDISVDGKPVPVYAVAEVVKGLLRGGGASADGAETDGQSDTSSSSSILNPKLGIFINGNIAFGDKDPTTNETGFDFDSTGLTFGMDYLFTDHFVAGIALGYANAEAKFFGNTGEQSSDFYSGTLFGTIMHDKWFVAGIGGIANGDYDTIRRISGPLLTRSSTSAAANGDSGRQLLLIT
jgi:hypothetical protein